MERECVEDWRLASGRIKMQDFNSPASVIWVLWPGGGLGLCIFLIGICGGTKINEDLHLTNQLGRAVERNSSWSSSFWCVCVCVHFIIAEHYSGTATDELGMIGSFHSNQSQSRNWNEAATWLPASSEADNQLWMLSNNEWKKQNDY